MKDIEEYHELIMMALSKWNNTSQFQDHYLLVSDSELIHFSFVKGMWEYKLKRLERVIIE